MNVRGLSQWPLVIVLAIVLTGCTEAGTTLRKCNYDADLATSNLPDETVRVLRRDQLIEQCMALKGYRPKPPAGAVIFFIDTKNSSAWENDTGRFFSDLRSKLHVDWQLAGMVFGMFAWLAVVVGIGLRGYGRLVRAYPAFDALIRGTPPWDQRVRTPARLLVMVTFSVAVAVLFVAAMIATIWAISFIDETLLK